MQRPRPLARGKTRAFPLLVALAASLIFTSAARAQGWLDTPPPVRSAVDARGVDTTTGFLRITSADVGMGDVSYVRSFVQTSTGAGWRHDLTGAIAISGSIYTVSIGGASETFELTGGVYQPRQGQRSTLSYDSFNSVYTYRSANGGGATFVVNGTAYRPYESTAYLTSHTAPSGEKLSFTYRTSNCTSFCYGALAKAQRLQSVTSNRGYQLKFEYAENGTPTSANKEDWNRVTKVTAINNAVDYCDPAADSCSSLTHSWPSVTYASPGADVWTTTDNLSRVNRITYSGGRIVGLRKPSSGSDDVTVAYHTGSGSGWGDHSYRVSSVTSAGLTWSYAYATESGGTIRKTTITGPGSAVTVVRMTSPDSGVNWFVASETDPLGKVTSYTYDGSGRITRVTAPEGNYAEYTYDSRGNVTETKMVAKSGSGLSNISRTASYDSSCSNPVKCNKPNSVTADGITTSLTYDSTHGGVLTSTTGGVESRATYSLLKAWYKDNTGSIVEAATGIYLPTETSICVTGNSCAGTAGEIKTTTTYGAASVANNRQPTAVTSGAGDASLTATTTTTYDAFSRVSTVDGPLSGSTDTVKYRYDGGGQLVGVIGPDPDGGSALKHRAVRNTYDTDGQVEKVETGTVNSQSDGDWANFAPLDYQTTIFDSVGRPIQATAYSGANAVLGIAQYSYDATGRPECTAMRMNAAVFGSLPGSACTLSTEGANGPDRISKRTYDAAGHVLTEISGLGSSLEQTTAAYAYTDNGKVATLTHPAIPGGNTAVTTYEYDGLDRLKKTRFPNKTTTGSSSSDYEQITYAGARIDELRKRDGTVIAYDYDGLGRVDETQVGASTGSAAFTFAYDNLGRQTQVVMTPYGASALTINASWDALSRKVSETDALGTVAYEYDLAGRRTKLTWPDTFYVNYDWDAAGGLTAIRENNASSGAGILATYAHDDLGRRTDVTYGNGVTTAYTFDAASRLSQLEQGLSGSTHDLTTTFTRNLAGQILTRTMTNDLYEPRPASPAEATRYLDHNNLNQATDWETSQLIWVGGMADYGRPYAYDARGNLTAEGAFPGDVLYTYSYNLQNQLTGYTPATGTAATLEYDPLGRLSKLAAAATTRFAYDAADMIAEYNSAGSTVLRRYVHGPATDEPIVWYEGSGTSDRRWLTADSQGSIIAVTNGSGVATAINSYEEYGKPGSGNAGRFQYTGQMWLGEVGLYHYKARAYSPTLGRFLQTDPIGYAGGPNVYAYVGNDPVNGRDPTGLEGNWCDHAEGRICSTPEDDYDQPWVWGLEFNICGVVPGLCAPASQVNAEETSYRCGCYVVTSGGWLYNNGGGIDSGVNIGPIPGGHDTVFIHQGVDPGAFAPVSCSSGSCSTTQTQTQLTIGWEPVLGGAGNHPVLIGGNRDAPLQSVATRAGPDWIPRHGSIFGTLTASTTTWKNSLDYGDPVKYQSLPPYRGTVGELYNMMSAYSAVINRADLPYNFLGPNSNTYVSTFLASIGVKVPAPAVEARGWVRP